MSTIIVLSLVIVSLTVAGCTQTVNQTSQSGNVTSPTPQPTYVPVNTPGYLNYTNRSTGIGIQYPPSWKVQEGDVNVTVLFTLPGTAVAFDVGQPQDLSGSKLSLDEFSQVAMSSFINNTTYTNVAVLNSNSTSLGGYPAKEYVLTFTSDGIGMQGRVVMTTVDNKGYVVFYGATKGVYPDYITTAQNMTQSFYIIG